MTAEFEQRVDENNSRSGESDSRPLGYQYHACAELINEPALVPESAICYFRQMTSISDSNFGPLVAYLVPGATALAGLTPYSATLRSWFAATPADAPTIGGFLYLTLAALACGMTISAIRWAVIDTIHSRTGLRAPTLDFSRLPGNVDAYSFLVSVHYRHYQFYSNMIVAAAIAYAGYYVSFAPRTVGSTELVFLVLEVIFFMTSRDTLRKYYKRGEQLLTSHTPSPSGIIWMP